MYLVCDRSSQTNSNGDVLYSVCRDFIDGRLYPQPSDDWLHWFHASPGFRSYVMGVANCYKNDLGLKDLPVCQQFDILGYHRKALALTADHEKVLDYLDVKKRIVRVFPKGSFPQRQWYQPVHS